MSDATTADTPASTPAPTATPETAAAPAAPATPAAGSLLAAGAPAAAPAAPSDPYAWLPAKHRVVGEGGALDLEASARKVAEAYQHAERRIGSGDIPPKEASGYKVNVPEAVADKVKAEDIQNAETFKGFMEKAHAAGLTQKQFDVVVGDFIERSLALQAGIRQMSEQEATAELRKTWKTDAEFQEGVQRAFKAGKAYAGEDFDSILNDYGNDPRIVRLLANVGRELSEDSPAPAGSTQGVSAQAELEQLTKSKAYMDANHPDHTMTKTKVDAIFQRLYGNSPKRSGPIVIQTG